MGGYTKSHSLLLQHVHGVVCMHHLTVSFDHSRLTRRCQLDGTFSPHCQVYLWQDKACNQPSCRAAEAARSLFSTQDLMNERTNELSQTTSGFVQAANVCFSV